MVIEPIDISFLYELWSTLIIYLYALGSSINSTSAYYACIAINPSWIVVQSRTLHDVYLIWLLEIAVLLYLTQQFLAPCYLNCLL